MMLINLDGKLVDPEAAKVSVLDRGFLYGDSVYEVVRTYGGKTFALSEHMERLAGSAKRLSMRLPDLVWLRAEIERTIQASKNQESYCRVIITRGKGPINLNPATAQDPLTVILVQDYEPFPDWMYRKGIRLAVASIRRNPPMALDPAIKSGNYLNSVIARQEADQAGFDDALMLTVDGRIAEATTANVFVAREGALDTPSLGTGILAGITRSLILELAPRNGIECTERDIFPDELARADEVILTSTLREVMPVIQVGGQTIGGGKPGPLAARLRTLFLEHIKIKADEG